jgi:hypothetical protein
MCENRKIAKPKLTAGNHEMGYIDNNHLFIEQHGTCIYGKMFPPPPPPFSNEVKVEKIQSMIRAVKKTIENGTLSLAHSCGTTIYSHTIITKNKVNELAQILAGLAEEIEDETNNEPPSENEITKLANSFEQLNEKIGKKEPFSEDDAKKLADGLNQFFKIRCRLLDGKIGENGAFIGGEGTIEEDITIEEYIFNLMNDTTNGITWIRIQNLNVDDQIPGLKYILGHDPFGNRDMGPVKLVKPQPLFSGVRIEADKNGKIILADSNRSSGFNNNKGTTHANYGVVDSKLLAAEDFPKIRTKYRKITKDECELAANSNYNTYLLERSKEGGEENKKIRNEEIEKRKHEDIEERKKEDMKRRKEEEKKKIEEEIKKRKEEEEKKKKEEEKKRKEEEERKRKEDEEKKKKEEGGKRVNKYPRTSFASLETHPGHSSESRKKYLEKYRRNTGKKIVFLFFIL